MATLAKTVDLLSQAIKSPAYRQKIFPIHLKVIQKLCELITALKSSGHSENPALSKIERNSYSRLRINKFSRSKYVRDDKDLDKFLAGAFTKAKQLEEFTHTKKLFYWYRRKDCCKTKSHSFGYDIDMFEFVNAEDYCLDFFGKENWGQMLEVIKNISLELSSIKGENIGVKYLKIYHYEGVIYPRPLHYDSFNNSSYKVFVFLGGGINPSQGAYSVIPGSHGKRLNQIMTMYNKCSLNFIWGKHTDGSFYNSRSAVRFENICDNEIVITKQNAIHGDFPANNKNCKKTALVFHLLPC